MPPRLRSATTNRRNNALQVVVNRHKNDPEFLARLLSTGIRAPIRTSARNYLTSILRREATSLRNLLTRNLNPTFPMHIFTVPGMNRRSRSLMGSAVTLPNTTRNQQRALLNTQNYIVRDIRPFINRLRLSQNRTHYRHPNRPTTRFTLMNNGRLLSRNGMLNYLFATGVRRGRGGRLEY